jgi:hypothetical protein
VTQRSPHVCSGPLSPYRRKAVRDRRRQPSRSAAISVPTNQSPSADKTAFAPNNSRPYGSGAPFPSQRARLRRPSLPPLSTSDRCRRPTETNRRSILLKDTAAPPSSEHRPSRARAECRRLQASVRRSPGLRRGARPWAFSSAWIIADSPAHRRTDQLQLRPVVVDGSTTRMNQTTSRRRRGSTAAAPPRTPHR